MRKLVALKIDPSKWFEVTSVAEEKVRLKTSTISDLSNADTVFLLEAIACAPIFSVNCMIIHTCIFFRVAQVLESYLLSHIFPDRQKSDSTMLVLQMVKLKLGKVEQASYSE